MNLERVAKRLFVGTGLALCAAAALTPMATFAEYSVSCDAGSATTETPQNVSCANSTIVAFNVLPTIMIDAYPGETSNAEGATAPMLLSATRVAHGGIVVRVDSNTSYNLSLNAQDGETSMRKKSTNSTPSTPTIPACTLQGDSCGDLTIGTSGWGIRDQDGKLRPLPASPAEFYKDLKNSNSTATTSDNEWCDAQLKVSTNKPGLRTCIPIEVTVDKELPTGIYTGTVVVTATAAAVNDYALISGYNINSGSSVSTIETVE